jgi:hypothetical protein
MNELQEFIASYIGSVEQLEILLLLHANPERSWSAKEISAQFRSNLDSVSARLQGLLNNGLATRTDDGKGAVFKYHSPSESMHQRVQELSASYVQKRSTIINMIYTGKSRAGASVAVQSLADAFRIKQGDDK